MLDCAIEPQGHASASQASLGQAVNEVYHLLSGCPCKFNSTEQHNAPATVMDMELA